MKKITMFYLGGCPYCRNARKAIEELKNEHPSFANIEIDMIEESEHPEISDNYDYDHVPCLYISRDKLYEAYPGQSYDDIKRNIQTVFTKALS